MSDVYVSRYVCIHKHARLGGVWGHSPSEIFFRKSDALRLLLRPVWDRRVFGYPRMHLLSQLTSNREKILRLAEQQAR